MLQMRRSENHPFRAEANVVLYMNMRLAVMIALCPCALCVGCAAAGSSSRSDSTLSTAISQPLSPDETQELLGEVGENWLYGQGLGETAAAVGAIAVFPPYSLWVAGNAIASMSGFEPIELSDALPEEEAQTWRETYDAITSAPGKASAAIAGEKFRSKEVAKERIQKFLKRREQVHPQTGPAAGSESSVPSAR